MLGLGLGVRARAKTLSFTDLAKLGPFAPLNFKFINKSLFMFSSKFSKYYI